MQRLTGLSLSRDYFFEVGLPELDRQMPELTPRLAAGLVGEGSDCFGYDDEISRDHSWGPGFYLWLGAEDNALYGERLQKLYTSLPQSFRGFAVKTSSAFEARRSGVFAVGDFYRGLIGLPNAPEQLRHWLTIPEGAFASAVNGEVFCDGTGEFTAVRSALLSYFPEDVRLKKLAGRCANAAQSGQYNLPRCVKRGEHVAALHALSQFSESACAIVFLLNRRYMPFYKWAHRALYSLPLLGGEISRLLTEIALTPLSSGATLVERAEDISQLLIRELVREGLTDSRSDFLLDHTPSVQSRIVSGELRAMPAVAY